MTETELRAKHLILLKAVTLQCGSGWFHILDLLLTEIENELRVLGGREEDYHITTIKEKFGALRFYAPSDGKIQEWIHLASIISNKICERCGWPGENLVEDGWYQTLCDRCRKSVHVGGCQT